MVANGSAGVAGPSSCPAHLPFSLGLVAQAGNGKSTASGTGMSGWATRPSEKGEWAGHDAGPARPSDPFAAIAAVDDEPPY